MNISLFRSLLLAVGISLISLNAFALDLTQIGGDLTSDLPGRHAIQVNAPNISDEARRVLQLAGFGVFHGDFTKNTGLGHDFIHSSCKGCHIDNGRGPARFSRANQSGSTMVVKISLPGLNTNGAPRDVPGIGEQLSDHAVSGKPLANIVLKWIKVEGSYPDGTKYTLRKPDLTFRLRDRSSRGLITSLRMTPPVIGPGLIEAVSDLEILKFSDPKDLDRDGISGRPNYVLDLKTGNYGIGRFGFKGSHITVEQQSAAALFNDMGITNPVIKGSDDVPELSDDSLNILAIYQKLAGVPRPIRQDQDNVIAGKALFQKINCSGCHRVTMETGEYQDPELSNQVFHPFTDLLLHYMGKGLADRRSEFSAVGSEWRTTPLWGIGFSKRLAKGKAVFLHDGRARTIEEAILWHGGEASRSLNAFKNLTAEERQELLDFLDSL